MITIHCKQRCFIYKSSLQTVRVYCRCQRLFGDSVCRPFLHVDNRNGRTALARASNTTHARPRRWRGPRARHRRVASCCRSAFVDVGELGLEREISWDSESNLVWLTERTCSAWVRVHRHTYPCRPGVRVNCLHRCGMWMTLLPTFQKKTRYCVTLSYCWRNWSARRRRLISISTLHVLHQPVVRHWYLGLIARLL